MCHTFSGEVSFDKGKDFGTVYFITGVHHEEDLKQIPHENLLCWESNAVGTFEKGIRFTHDCGKDVSGVVKKELEKLVLEWAGKQDVEKLLEKIAVEDSAWSVRLEAVGKITNETLLEKIAVEDNDWSVRLAAVKKITNETLLEKIAVEDSDCDVRFAVKHQLKTIVK